jgi:hypothetical protein
MADGYIDDGFPDISADGAQLQLNAEAFTGAAP